jgi:hypothetical protein
MRPLLPLLVLFLALGGCGKPPSAGQDLDRLDEQLTGGAGNRGDVALAATLHDQIMVDPQLAQSANNGAVRPAPRPDSGAMPPDDLGAPRDTSRPGDLKPAPAATPGCRDCTAARGALTLGALAERQSQASVAACAGGLRYATGWADKLPPALPLYPDARVAEAAGNDAGGCSLRVVSFASSAAPSRVVDWYYAHAARAGFAADHHEDGMERVLRGTHGPASFMLYLRPRAGGGTEADLVTAGG